VGESCLCDECARDGFAECRCPHMFDCDCEKCAPPFEPETGAVPPLWREMAMKEQLAEARAEVERVTREREEQRRRRESVESDREALVREVAAARRERDEARAELAAARQAVALWHDRACEEYDRAVWAEGVAGEAMRVGLAECQRLRDLVRGTEWVRDLYMGATGYQAARADWAEHVARLAMAEGLATVTDERERADWARRATETAETRAARWVHEAGAERQIARCAEDRARMIAAEAARWKWWAKIAVAAYVEAEGGRDRAWRRLRSVRAHTWEASSRGVVERERADAAEARARGLVAVLREARALLIDEHDEGEGVSCGACSAVVRIDAALAAAEGGE
jgi:hypothetical protein